MLDRIDSLSGHFLGYSAMKKAILKSIFFGCLTGLAILGVGPVIQVLGNKAIEVKNLLIKKVTKIEIVEKYVTMPEIPTDDLMNQISLEMKINPLITHAIARQESGRNYKEDALRFEPHLEARFSKLGKGKEETRMLATSIGVMQVIPGFHLRTCGLDSYADLFDRATNIKCGLTVLKDCLARHSKKPKLEQYKLALACYNGGDTYASSIIKNIGEIAIEMDL